jgi:hypothetical protein
MTSQQPKLTTPDMRDTDIKEDQEKDGLTVFQKHAPKKGIELRKAIILTHERKLLTTLERVQVKR